MTTVRIEWVALYAVNGNYNSDRLYKQYGTAQTLTVTTATASNAAPSFGTDQGFARITSLEGKAIIAATGTASDTNGLLLKSGQTILLKVNAADTLSIVSTVNPYSDKQQGRIYTLVSGTTLTAGTGSTQVDNLLDGAYTLSLTASAWNSATVKAQYLGADGSTWLDVVDATTGTAITFTANSTRGVVIGSNASVRILATGGNPTSVYATLS